MEIHNFHTYKEKHTGPNLENKRLWCKINKRTIEESQKGDSTDYQSLQSSSGPIFYISKNKAISKCYILLFSCSVSRAIHLVSVSNLTTQEFIKSMKRLIAWRGSPKIVYSDNPKIFREGAKWLTRISKDEKFHNFLSNESITWKFNLSKAPWWGGQFEQLIGLTKQTIYITIGKAHLKWAEPEEVLLDIEVNLNNRPLTYIEDDTAY